MKLTLTAVSAFALALTASAATYQIDSSHSSSSFKVRHMMISNVTGEFGKTAGTIEFDPANVAVTKINATIDATTINTREAKRDAHLKSADFFEVEKYPTITFASKKVERTGDNKYKVTGDLNLHGVTREVVLNVETSPEVKDARGGLRIGANGTTRINRKDFGLTWNRALETGGMVVSEEVDITIDVQLVKQAAAKTTD
jgi:polyisoprenoid-binding protein YceI